MADKNRIVKNFKFRLDLTDSQKNEWHWWIRGGDRNSRDSHTFKRSKYRHRCEIPNNENSYSFFIDYEGYYWERSEHYHAEEVSDVQKLLTGTSI